jgi:hypothetical protein
MALRSDGSGDFLNRTTGGFYSPTVMTVCFWAKREALFDNGGTWWALGGPTESPENYLTFYNLNGDGHTFIWEQFGGETVGSLDMVQDTWYFIAFSRSGTGTNQATAYNRTASATSFTSATATFPNADAVSREHILANPYNTALAAKGSIAGLKQWAAALTEAELWLESQSLQPVRTADLHSGRPMVDNTVAGCGSDYSGNGRNLTASGSLLVADGPPVAWGLRGRRIIIPPMPTVQIARPDSDVSAGSWTATTLFSKVDEAIPDDSDLIQSALPPSNDTCELGLSNVTDPSSSSGHSIRVRRRKSAPSGNHIDMRYRLLEGTTEIASWTDDTDISDTAWKIIGRTLNGTQADAITDYTNLRIEIRANQNAQTPSAPSFTAAGTASNTATSGTSLTPGLPAGFQADDIHILVAHHSSNTDFNDPAGWTRITALTGNNTTAQRVVAWWRRAQNGDSGPSVATASASTAVRIARIYGVRGCVTTGDPWDSGSGAGPSRSANAASATISSTSITTTVVNCLALFFGAYEDDPTTASLPTGYTAIGVSGTTTGNDAMLCGWHKQLSGTSTENPSTTVSGGTFTNSVNTGLMIALKPEPFPDVRAEVSWVEFQVPEAGSGTTFNITPSGSITPAAVLIKQAQKLLAGSSTPTGALIKQDQKALSGSVMPAGALLKHLQRLFSGSITPTGALTMLKAVLRSFGGSIAPIGTIIRQGGKTLTGAVVPTGLLLKTIVKLIAGAVTPTGALATLKAVLRSFAGSIGPIGALLKQTQKPLGGSVAPVGTLTKQDQKRFTGSVTPAATLANIKAILRTFAGSITPSGSLIRQGQKSLIGAISPVGTVIKSTVRRLTGTITPAGTLTVLRAVLRSFSGSIAPSRSLRRSIGKVVGGSISPLGAAAKGISKLFSGILTLAGNLINFAEGAPLPKTTVTVSSQVVTPAAVSSHVVTLATVSGEVVTTCTVSSEIGG